MKAEAAGRPTPVTIFAGRYRLSPKLKKEILLLAKRIIKSEKKKLTANLIFIDGAKMRTLNRRFRGKDKTTDILSFPIEANGKKVEGEIYISFPQAKRQAPLFGNRPEGEILRLSAHGFLHLLGYAHQTVAERIKMFAREEKYLKGLEALSSRGERC
ncbi:MAG: rRNA maturation RNase YbeY [Limisphaerales bacterium]